MRVFSFRIFNVAYKNVQPILLEFHEKKTNVALVFLAKLVGIHLLPSVWYLKFSYINHNLDPKVDRIFFKSKEDAIHWYNFVFDYVFLEKNTTPPPVKPPPPPPKKQKILEKLKKTEANHLKIVKNDETKNN